MVSVSVDRIRDILHSNSNSLTSQSRWLIIIFLLALGLRLLYLFLAPQTPVVWDAAGYNIAGRSLADGHVSEYAWKMIGSRGPGYPLFLSAVFSFLGEDLQLVRYIQAGLDALTAVFVYLIARQLANRHVALVTGLIMATYPSFILFTGRILTETLAIFLLWFGIFMLVRGLHKNNLAWLAGAGGLIGLASLTRPTLLPVVLFMIMAVMIGMQHANLRRRFLSSAVFIIPVLTLLLSWNVLASTRVEPVVGSNGLRTMVITALESIDPDFRGWATDSRAGTNRYWWKDTLQTNPIYPVASAVNSVFYHMWFSDNGWREVLVLSPSGMNWLQRGIFLLGLGGIGIGLIRWRLFAPLLFLLIAFAIVSVKWIEIRHSLPFLPAIFIFAGLFLVHVIEWTRQYPSQAKKVAALGGLIALTIAVLYGFKTSNLVTTLPFVRPVILGIASDLAIIAVSLVWGGMIFHLAKRSLGYRQGLIVGFAPIFLFVALFGSYAYVSSEPRWRAWSVDLGSLQLSVVQEIQLPSPLYADQIESAEWLVDLQTDLNPPPLAVAINGLWISPDQVHWQQFYCGSDHDEIKACGTYKRYARFANRSISTWPQWWSISVDPELLEGKDVLSLTLNRDSATVNFDTAGQIKLGGTFSNEPETSFYGPSINAHSGGTKTSLYRWVVTQDWRIWETTKLASIYTRSSFVQPEPISVRANGHASITKSVPSMVDQQNGHFGIRLLVRFKNGQQAIY